MTNDGGGVTGGGRPLAALRGHPLAGDAKYGGGGGGFFLHAREVEFPQGALPPGAVPPSGKVQASLPEAFLAALEARGFDGGVLKRLRGAEEA